ncbi:branched-chain amino acid ABC transporter permease [Hydrogenophaga sp. 2FB]|uniref:branched-chain amino acid ABC transporter permease n=1 Tax=Hydrogenophaga sp. 2FB TaxID=2502187 RepID=UPI0010F63459|nr:branched-chain amino acid ABC transporter permease [Hydrogenophaga sp. 2FB]
MRTRIYKTSYADLVALTPHRSTWVWAGVGLLLVACAPLVLGSHGLGILSAIFVMAIGVLGLNLLTGVTGQISLGHAGFLLIGAYAQAVLTTDYHVPAWLAIFASGAVAAVASLVVGVPSLRLKGLYLAITTLAFTFIVRHLVLFAEDITRGSEGMAVAPLALLGYEVKSDQPFFYVALAMLVLFVLLTLNLMRSPIGRAWLAVRDHDIAARAMGINLMRYKLLAFMVSAFYTGVAGALVALQTRYINVDTFSILISIEALAMIIVGGLGRVHGALLGTALILLLPELLNFGFSLAGDRFTTLMSDRIYEIKGLMYGVVILLFLRLEPEGLAGIWRKVKRFWVHWPLSQ